VIVNHVQFDAPEESADELLLKRAKDRIRRIKEFWTAYGPDRDRVRDNYAFREGMQSTYVPKNPDELDSHFTKKLKFATNLLEYVLSTVATVYVTPAKRTAIPPVKDADAEGGQSLALVDDDVADAPTAAGPTAAEQRLEAAISEATDWFSDHVWNYGLNNLDETLLDADRDVLFGGSVAIEPRYMSDWNATGVDGIEAIYYRRHEYEVLPMESDPRVAEAVVFPVKTIEELVAGTADSLIEKQVYHYWDGEVWARLVDWEIDDRPPQIVGDPSAFDGRMYKGLLKHGIGFLPIVFVKRTRVQRQFHSRGCDDYLVQQCGNINKLWTEFGHILRVQHGYPVVKGDLQNGTIATDGIIQIDTDGEFKVEAPKANLDGMERGIQRIMDNIALTKGMAPGSITMDPNRTSSGVAIVVQQSEQERVRQEDVSTWLSGERRFHRAQKAVYQAFSPNANDMPDADLKVEHQRPKTHISLQEKERNLGWQRDRKLIDRKTMLQTLDPDMSEDQIEKQLRDADADQPVANGQTGARPGVSGFLRAGLTGSAATTTES
jgi:hypothetical protein